MNISLPHQTSRAAATVLATLAIAIAIAIGASRAQASDHIDSPTIAQDRGSDIADIYAFLDPNDNSQSS